MSKFCNKFPLRIQNKAFVTQDIPFGRACSGNSELRFINLRPNSASAFFTAKCKTFRANELGACAVKINYASREKLHFTSEYRNQFQSRQKRKKLDNSIQSHVQSSLVSQKQFLAKNFAVVMESGLYIEQLQSKNELWYF